MDKPEAITFIRLLYAGVLMMLVLVIAVVVFVVLHQKNAYLLQAQLRQQELDYQASMLQAVVASQESERERIAHDLHDEIGAMLSTARLFVNQVQYELDAPHLQEMAQRASHILGDTLHNVRHIVQNLSPAMLEKFGLGRAIALLGDHLEAAGLRVELHVDEAAESLAAPAQLALYRIVQEIFANTTRHAQAQRLTLHLLPAAGQLKLTVADDGRGFTPALAGAGPQGGMGLAGMRARAGLLGGQLQITSSVGQGTHIELLLPR
jgi:two-component system NarL family sensor kinase